MIIFCLPVSLGFNRPLSLSHYPSPIQAISLLPTMFSKASPRGRLTLYHTILTFNNIEKEEFRKTLLEKEKMLVTSIFSFSQNVFYPSLNKFQFFHSHFFSSANAFNLDQFKVLSFGKE